MKKILLPFAFLLTVSVSAQGVVKTMFYNVLNYPTAPPSNREVYLREIVHDFEPDIFMICELETETGGQEILDEALNFYNNAFTAAPFVENTSNDWMDNQLQQLLYFRTNTFDLVETDIVQTYLRDINMYKLQLLSEQGPEEVFFYVFVAHLKASSGSDNEQDRLSMVTDFTDYLNQLPADANVIFAGDFNLYSASEPAYAEALNLDGTNAITMVDPINEYGEWHNNNTYSNILTQSTRISNADFENYGAGGGLDDRFDFILLSENLSDQTSPVHYIENSYAAFGNNGGCFNQNINDSDCSGSYSQSLRNALYNMSDHLPVVLEIETSQTLSVTQQLVNNEIELISGNVVNEKLEFNIPQALQGNKFAVYNTLGQRMQTFSPKNSLTIRLDVSSYPNGMYFVVFENSPVAPIKFIKNL